MGKTLKIINTSGITLYINDVDIHIPYSDNKPLELPLDLIKESYGIRTCIAKQLLEIVEIGNSDFERRLLQSIVKSTNTTGNHEKVNGVTLRGQIYENMGFSKVNRNLAIALTQLGFNVNTLPCNNNRSSLDEKETALFKKFEANVLGNVVIDSQIPTGRIKSASDYNILNTTVESLDTPSQFAEVCNQYDEIWTPSLFCQDVLSRISQKPVFLVPNIIDSSLYNEKAESLTLGLEGRFVFLSIGSWGFRKGHDLLLKAYLEEFNNSDNVTLLIVCDATKNDIAGYTETYGSKAAEVRLINQQLPERLMPSLYRACDAFVLFSRGEGFGLPYCEASMCGLPVIATNWSGQRDFLNNENSTLIEIDELVRVPPGTTNIHFWDDKRFPSLTSPPCVTAAREALRVVYKNHGAAKTKNKQLQEFIKDRYSYDAVASIVEQRLSTHLFR